MLANTASRIFMNQSFIAHMSLLICENTQKLTGGCYLLLVHVTFS